MFRSRFLTIAVLLAMLIVSAAPGPAVVQAASHREAPLISMDAEADITDFFMFRSYEPGHEDKVVFIMNVIPGEEPSSGPNYFNFDPNVSYKFEIDNDADGKADDISIDFRFSNEFRGTNRALGLFLSHVAVPPITALDGEGSEGLGWRQKYTVSMTKKDDRDKIGRDLIVVPSNVGPRTMPDYAALAAQGIYDLGDGVRVFAGQREDPFFIDLGATFDTLNFRKAPLLTAAEDANDTVNPFGIDMLSGFNVNTIAIEVPISWVTKDHKGAAETKYPTIGAYASTSRRSQQVLRSSGINAKTPGSATVSAAAAPDASKANLYLPYVQAGAADQADQAEAEAIEPVDSASSNFVQVQRLANPLVNEAIIGTIDKDRWNALEPRDEKKFLDYYQNPRFATALQLVFGITTTVAPREDLVNLLLKYKPTDKQLSELLRLNLSVPPTPLADQKRLTVLAHDAAGVSTPDNAGWPNGRRPKDDVTDIAVRVIGGANYIAGMAGDGVNTDDATLPAAFPFLATPFDGRNRTHQNP
ncbi:MAG: DUF4331 domain-containing protein [Chloroflexi bacterium]|nr:DUF4331 domain-containing protein [Chloroflexota bacterium]